MMSDSLISQRQFYERFLMARSQIDPRAHGVDMDSEQFYDTMFLEFESHYQISLDELLLHPREALNFCDTVRRKHGCFSLPDDIILRAALYRRKHPKNN